MKRTLAKRRKCDSHPRSEELRDLAIVQSGASYATQRFEVVLIRLDAFAKGFALINRGTTANNLRVHTKPPLEATL